MRRDRTTRCAERRVWLIQVRLHADKGCTIADLKRLLKGTGVEVDVTYSPKRVGPAVFVGRGWATARAVRIIQRGVYSLGTHGTLLRPPRRDITLFEEIRFGDPEPTLDYYYGQGAERELIRARAMQQQDMLMQVAEQPGAEVF